MSFRRFLQIGASSMGILLTVLFLMPSVAEQSAVASKNAAIVRLASRSSLLLSKKNIVLRPIKRERPYLVLASPGETRKPTLLAIADQPSFEPQHRLLADHVLRALPSHCRLNLKNFYILYTDAKQRGLGGKTTIILDGSVGNEELTGLLTHECGHVIHSNMPGNMSSGESAFRDGNAIFYNDSPIVRFFAISWKTENVLLPGTKKTDFVSGYAKSDAFEEFSETFAMYALHRDALRLRAKDNAAIAAKLAWMETYLPMPEGMIGESRYLVGKEVPWDITKLPFVLADQNP